jgi:hypothetical protein
MKQYSISVHKTSNTNKIIPDHDLENLVSIFVNDEIATEDEDYSIKDNKIVFNRELNDSDDLKMNYSYDTNKNIISKGKINKNSILSRFNSDIKLNENNKYRIGIVIDKELYEWEFNSKQNPMFSTARQVLEDIGEFIEGFTEEYINNKIYDNSLAVIDLIDELASLDTPVENVTYEKDEDGFYTTTYKAVKNWVRYKTDIDLTLARYFGISYHYGSEMKEIGDIKIEKSTKLPYIDNLLDFLKKQWDEADKVIRGTNVVSSAVKAGTQYKYDDWNRDTTW